MSSTHFCVFAYLILIISSCKPQERSLDIEALPIEASVDGVNLSGPSVLSDSNRFVWGGSVIQGNDGKYHMLYSTWEVTKDSLSFYQTWVTRSEIAHAVSSLPDRDFIFQGIVLRGRSKEGDHLAWDAQMVHNPHIKKFGDHYYLYYIGSVDPGEQSSESAGAALDFRARVQQNQKIGVIKFKSFNDLISGNFQRPDQPLLSPRTRVKKDNIVAPSPKGTVPKPDNVIVVNPSVVYRPSDGKYLLYFKGNFYDPSWRGVHGVAIGDDPSGPFLATDNFVFDIRLPDKRLASTEDPFVWYSKAYEKFFVVFKDFSGKVTSSGPGLAMLASRDGIQWVKPEKSLFMKKRLLLTSGDTISVERLERPQLLVDENGNPKVLYAACSVPDIRTRRDGVSYNVQIPLKTE